MDFREGGAVRREETSGESFQGSSGGYCTRLIRWTADLEGKTAEWKREVWLLNMFDFGFRFGFSMFRRQLFGFGNGNGV